MTAILFCSRAFEPREVEPDFARERERAVAEGFGTLLFDHTEAVEGSAERAVREVGEGAGQTVYRGWMLRPSEYADLHRALGARGAELVNSPEAYRFCHHLPESYGLLKGRTPRTSWLKVEGEVDFAAVGETLRGFGGGAVIVKDYVKSQKHAWGEACFIPRADDAEGALRVVRRFLELQGADLAEGLVFREYVPLRIAGVHPKSGMPLGAEVRSFWLDGELVLAADYWGQMGAVVEEAPIGWMREVAREVPSRFFTMDVALREDGGWTIIELGDGQVAGLPEPGLSEVFYRRLKEVLGG